MKEAALFLALLVVGAGVGIALTAGAPHSDEPSTDRLAPASVDEPTRAATAAKPQHAALFARSLRGTVHEIHLNDSLTTGAALCPGVSSSCASFPGSEKRSLFLGPGEEFGAFDINVSWTPQGPLTQRFEIAIRACPTACRGGEPVLATAQGLAPLRLHDELPFVPTGERIFLEVTSAMPGPTVGAALHASTMQPFRVDGTIVEPQSN